MSNFIIKNSGTLKYLEDTSLGVVNGFSTRQGGFSTIPYLSSLNLGYNLGDSEDTVKKNRDLFISTLGLSSFILCGPNQIHSNIVKIIDRNNYKEEFSCDGFVTKEKDIILSIKTADCAPILLSDSENGIIGACHAGWRGTVSCIVTNTIDKMIEIGAKKENIKISIGPCIHPCCYEVKEDFFNSVKELKGEDFALRHIIFGKANIVSMNKEILTGNGIREDQISVCEYCTCCNLDLFFSHRGGKGKRGLMMAVISNKKT